MKIFTYDVVSRLLAEFLGTSMLVFFGCLGCVGNLNGLLQISLNAGFTVMLIVQTFGCVSGAHLSPAITMAALIMDFISPLLSLGYLCAQILGCYAGYALLMFLIPKTFLPIGHEKEGFCLTMPHPELGYMQAVAIEFVITGTLVVFACSFWDPRNTNYGQTAALKFGLAIVGLALTAVSTSDVEFKFLRALRFMCSNNKYLG